MARTPRKKTTYKIEVKRLTEKQKLELGIPPRPAVQGPWHVWECGPSAFKWHYDEVEKCYLYEGEVKVITASGEVSLKKGDFVKFPKGLSCRWEVHKKVKKVYLFE